jgi:hypothetical protein
MRLLSLILGAAAAAGVAAAVSADPVADRIQMAQAQDSGMQSGSGTGANQRGPSGNREGGAAATRGAEGVARRRGNQVAAATGCAAKRNPRAARGFKSAPEARASGFGAGAARSWACARPEAMTPSSLSARRRAAMFIASLRPQ